MGKSALDKDSGAFADGSDSGAVVADGAGRMSSDAIYVTLISIVLNFIQSHEPLAKVYFKSAPSA